MPSNANEDFVALLLLCMTLFSFLSSWRWKLLVPQMFFREAMVKEREIAKLQRDSAHLNTPSSYVQYAKSQRQVQALEKEVAEIRAGYKARGLLYIWAPSTLFYFIRYGFILPAYMIWSQQMPELVMIPDYFVLHPSRWFVSPSLGPMDISMTGSTGWFPRSCGVFTWILLCHIAIRYCLACAFPNRSF